MKKLSVLRIVSLLIIWLSFSSNLYADEWTHLAKGSKFQEEGKYIEAITEYRKAIDINPKIIDAYCNIGYVYQYFLFEYKNAQDAYLTGLKHAPDDFSLNMNLMYLYFKMDKLEKGIKIYEKLSTLNKSNISYTFPKKIVDNLVSGMTADKKIDFCRKYLEFNSTDQILRNVLADSLFEKKNYTAAQKEYLSILKQLKESESSLIYFKLGICEYYLNNFNAALSHLEKAEHLGQYVPKVYMETIEKKIIENSGK